MESSEKQNSASKQIIYKNIFLLIPPFWTEHVLKERVKE